MSSWGHTQAGLSVRLREASEAGSAGWLSPPCDGLQHTRLPVFPSLPELAQTHVHWVGNAIQPAHPLLPPSPFAFNLSQHHGLFQWVGSFHQVPEVMELWHQSFQWIFRDDFLQDWLVWSPCHPRTSQESFPASQLESIKFLLFLILSCPFLICFFLFIALELIHSISVLLMHEDCIRFKVSWYLYLFFKQFKALRMLYVKSPSSLLMFSCLVVV